MTRAARHSLGLCVWLALGACGDSGPRDPSQWPISRTDLVRGETPLAPGEGTYNRYCIACHGADGRGNNGVTGANFAAANSPLLTRSDEELRASVREGKRGLSATMPAHKPVLNDAQIDEVVAFVKKRFQPAEAAAPAPTP